jgi:hypothetical protein
MSPTGFETAIPASERPHTHALERAATGVGWRVDFNEKLNDAWPSVNLKITSLARVLFEVENPEP